MIFFQEIQLDNYFIMKLFRKYITEEEFPGFYQYHLDHYKSRLANATEEKQFTVIWEIIQDGIRIQDRHPHSEIAKRRKKKLLAFQNYLRSIDQWHHSNTMEELVRIKNKEIEDLTVKLETVKKELSRLKVDYKIKINHVDRTSVFDIFLQMRELTAPESGSRVFIDPAQSTWAKILSNHFEDDSAIPFDTALNYFRGKSQVQEAQKRFEVRNLRK